MRDEGEDGESGLYTVEEDGGSAVIRVCDRWVRVLVCACVQFYPNNEISI